MEDLQPLQKYMVGQGRPLRRLHIHFPSRKRDNMDRNESFLQEGDMELIIYEDMLVKCPFLASISDTGSAMRLFENSPQEEWIPPKYHDEFSLKYVQDILSDDNQHLDYTIGDLMMEHVDISIFLHLFYCILHEDHLQDIHFENMEQSEDDHYDGQQEKEEDEYESSSGDEAEFVYLGRGQFTPEEDEKCKKESNSRNDYYHMNDCANEKRKRTKRGDECDCRHMHDNNRSFFRLIIHGNDAMNRTDGSDGNNHLSEDGPPKEKEDYCFHMILNQDIFKKYVIVDLFQEFRTTTETRNSFHHTKRKDWCDKKSKINISMLTQVYHLAVTLGCSIILVKKIEQLFYSLFRHNHLLFL